MGAQIAALVVSRRKSIAKLKDDIATFVAQIAKVGETSEAGLACASVLRVQRARLVKLEEELRGFESLLAPADARQTEIPAAKPPTVRKP